MYDAASVDPQSLLIAGAVSFEGWGVAALELKHLGSAAAAARPCFECLSTNGKGTVALPRVAVDVTEFGFVVNRSPDEDDPVNGQFHYLARPSELDANNQIPLSVRDVLASKAIWLIRPIRS